MQSTKRDWAMRATMWKKEQCPNRSNVYDGRPSMLDPEQASLDRGSAVVPPESCASNTRYVVLRGNPQICGRWPTLIIFWKTGITQYDCKRQHAAEPKTSIVRGSLECGSWRHLLRLLKLPSTKDVSKCSNFRSLSVRIIRDVTFSVGFLKLCELRHFQNNNGNCC